MERCRDPRGNELCTNGVDTYHEFNAKYTGGCSFCGESYLKEDFTKEIIVLITKLLSIAGGEQLYRKEIKLLFDKLA